ncbi:MAG: EAL domain-containing protein [Lachnospiraceae bacterium]|nr:EAL domain-containing protein [Lachnospiraceae bacterium]
MDGKLKNNRLFDFMSIVNEKVNNNLIVQCVKTSLVMIIPMIMVGAFSLVLVSFPMDAYQNFIKNFASGLFYLIFNGVYSATFGMMSVYMTVSVALTYTNMVRKIGGYFFGPVFSSLFAFTLFSGVISENGLVKEALGVDGLFTAIVSGLLASALYCFVQERVGNTAKFYTYGADDVFYMMLKYVYPTFITAIFFVLLSTLINVIFGVGSFRELCINIVTFIFENTGRNFGSTLLYLVIVHLLWAVGMHGGNILQPVADSVFAPAITENQKLIQLGLEPTQMFSKTFIDVFVLMGGCGTTICLLLAILLFGKRRSNKKLVQIALLPGIFNINEIMMFGLPVVFNPIILVPFFITPIITFLISTLAMMTGLVPYATSAVEWTTPVIVGGYYATGSVAGSILQVVNIIVGTLIYWPFVKLIERETQRNSTRKIEQIAEIIDESEEMRKPVNLLELNGDLGIVCRIIADTMISCAGKELPTVYYQPQCDENEKCIGAEALLRISHKEYGLVYPPIIMKLAEEAGILLQTEKDIFASVVKDMDELIRIIGDDADISVNVTGITLKTEEFELFLKEMAEKNPDKCNHITIELTEQATLKIDDEFISRLQRIRDMGYRLAIDDFSMGNTSIKYLESNVFSKIKLDGVLSRHVVTNERSQEIVSTLAKMSKGFNIDILAEYVETEQQKQILSGIGCHQYQGHLYSQAVPLHKLEDMVDTARKE